MDILIEILDDSTTDDILSTIHSYQPLDFYILLINHSFSHRWMFIGKKTYRNDKKHSFDDKPAVINSNGDQYWYQHNKYHRDDDKPAVIYSNGSQYWYKNDKLHRDDDKPALIYAEGSQRWYQYGKLLSRVIKAV